MRTGSLDIQGVLNAGVWQLCYENLLAAPAASVTISGLDGDVDEEYRLVMFSKYGGTAQTLLTFNADGGSSYGTQDLTGKDAITGAQRTATTSINLTDAASANGSVGFGEYIIKAKSGKQRTIISKRTSPIATTTVGSIGLMGATWTNTADNLTSITLTNANLDTGTHIILFKRTPIGSVATSGMRTGDITVAGTLSAGCMQKIYSTTLAAAATSVTLSGLDGDVDTLYELRVRQIGGANQTYCGFRLNADTGANYGTQAIAGTSTSASAYRETGAGIAYTTLTGNNTNELTQICALIYGASGNIRPAIIESSTAIATTTVGQIRLLGDVWNSTANITSLTFLSDTADGLGIGTYIELWALRKHS